MRNNQNQHRYQADQLSYYPGIDIPHCQISAFAVCMDVVILSLKDMRIIRVMPAEIQAFRQWLLKNRIREVDQKNI
ncbi:hypothetical protein [Taibaiella soli]|nr:hypothetical protein [Taibaiella soli]